MEAFFEILFSRNTGPKIATNAYDVDFEMFFFLQLSTHLFIYGLIDSLLHLFSLYRAVLKILFRCLFRGKNIVKNVFDVHFGQFFNGFFF